MAHGYLRDGYGTHGEIDPDRDNDRDRRDRDDRRERGSDRERNFMFDDRDREWDRDRYSANPDEHYRSWRERHMAELDRDYEDYCSERERDFHRGFDEWRRNKYGNPQPLRTGMTQSGISHDPSGMDEAAEDDAPAAPMGADPTADATLGTNSSGGARGRR
ncbi:MAG TPA: hypothetical protein VFW39_06180 [Sphingomicrobium sp.]|nr:hypothetical protein [Sphingomicrobium sp.]